MMTTKRLAIGSLFLVGVSCVDGARGPQQLQLVDGGSAGSGERASLLPIGELGAAGGPRVDWARRFGGSGADLVWNAASDGSGNAYLVGRFESPSLELGGSPLLGSGAGDIFFGSFDGSGQHRWSMSFGGGAADNGRAVAARGPSVYIAGDVSSASVNFGGGGLPGLEKADIFVAGFSAAGKYKWAKRLAGDTYELASAIAFDGGGNLYLTGCFTSKQIDFGGGPVASAGPNNVFVASYSPEGVYRWARHFGAGYPSCGVAIAVDGSGNLYAAGHYTESITMGGVKHASRGKHDLWIASFTTTSALRWARSHGGPEGDAVSMLTAINDEIYLAGTFGGSATFGGATIASAGGADIVVARYASGGDHVWSRAIGGPGDDFVGAVAAERGNLALTGAFREALSFAGTTLASRGGADVLVASLSPDGSPRWALGLGGSGDDGGAGIAAGAPGQLFVAGSFRGEVDLGHGALASAGGDDAFLLRLTAP